MGRRIIDLTLPLTDGFPGYTWDVARDLDRDGWNARTLHLYSHCGTHVDAPRHFIPDGATLETLALEVLHGPARVIDLTPVAERELLTVAHLGTWADRLQSGDRILLRTDWSHRAGTPAYREALPRIGDELAGWLVRRGIRMVGVEPPSVADVNDLEEVTRIHRILLGGGVVIIEGLNRLERIGREEIEFTALPLLIPGGDGAPARAIAVV